MVVLVVVVVVAVVLVGVVVVLGVRISQNKYLSFDDCCCDVYRYCYHQTLTTTMTTMIISVVVATILVATAYW